MSFRQDSDPGSVKSLLALLRSNQDANTSNTSNSVAGGSATATPPPAPPAANDPYSLASNPFHQATYGHSGSSAGISHGHQHQPERAHAHGYDYGYQPGSAQTGGSSLQDLLATLRRNNTDSISPRPSGSASREIHSHPSWIETLTVTERRELEREEDRSQSQASGSKRRRIERQVDREVEVERGVDPYAEDDQHRRPERGYEYGSYEANGTDDRDYDHDLDRPARIPQPEHVVQVEDPPQSAAIDLSANPDNDNEVEEEEDNQMNRYGYTPEQMSDLSIEEGKPIVEELIMRGDVVDKLKKVRLAQSALFPYFGLVGGVVPTLPEECRGRRS
jgi:hypothetical protein